MAWMGINIEEEKTGRENWCGPNSLTRSEMEVVIPPRVAPKLDSEDRYHPERSLNRKDKSSSSGFVSLEKTDNDRKVYEIN